MVSRSNNPAKSWLRRTGSGIGNGFKAFAKYSISLGPKKQVEDSHNDDAFDIRYDNSGRPIPTLLNEAHDFTRADEVKDAGLYFYFRPIREVSDDETKVVLTNGQECIMFGSNSYLGLTKDPRVVEASLEATRRYGTGNAGSRFLNGNLSLHDELEERLAHFVGKPAALLFPTGFQANLGFGPLISGKDVHVFSDRSDHASILSGILLARSYASKDKKMSRFDHNDMGDLEKQLALVPKSSKKLIIVDGVYSMEGDIARLKDIVELKKKYNAAVLVDDAHAVGVLGKRLDNPKHINDGRGTAAHFGVTEDIDLIMGTFSKSYASIGGYLAGDRRTIDFLRHNAHSEIFSASSPAGCVAAVLKTIDIMEREPERIRRLWDNTDNMRNGLLSLGYNLGKSETPILPLYVGGAERTLTFCKDLQNQGIFVNPVVPPGVPMGKELIRLSLMATHTPEQIAYALGKIEGTGRKLGII